MGHKKFRMRRGILRDSLWISIRASMIRPGWCLVLLLFLARTVISQSIPEACGGLNMMQVRMVIAQAIESARNALAEQKQLNEYLSKIGFDEAVAPNAYVPKTYHQHYAAFSHLNLAASLQVDSGFIVNHATRTISQTLGINTDDLYRCPGVVPMWHEMISPYCRRREAICNVTSPYRTNDGSCNNLQHPLWGRSNRPHRRFLKSVYWDDIGLPRQLGVTGEFLPSPRTVSNVVHHQDPCCPLKQSDLSLYIMQWGQTMDHDITDTAIAKGADDANIMCCNISQEVLMRRSECFPIPIQSGDERFKETCMNFVRSIAGHDDNCDFGRRNQLNQATSYIDASFLYGHNDEDANEIRSFVGGRLKMTDRGLFPAGQDDETHCELQNPGDYCMKSGDFRIHVAPGLTAIQVVFLREHNRIAATLERLNPGWCDEDLYQESRKILIGLYQHITFAHWLPRIVGPMVAMRMGLLPAAKGHSNSYDPNVDATISNIFGVSAFRFGHTLLQNDLLYMKGQGTMIRNEMLFNRPGMIFMDESQGCNFVGMGLALNPASKADGKIVDSVRNNLFLDMNGRSFDLISLNIQRGRDHAVPGYNAWRMFCGLPYAMHFGTGPGGLIHHTPEDAMKLYSVYRHPDDIDIFAGGMSEIPVEGGVLGPLFACIVGHQFQNLKRGDRFYYENADENTGFTEDQLASIRKMTLGKLMCLHFHLPHVQMDPFRMPGPRNPMVNCNMFEDIDLSLWRRDLKK